MFGAPCVELTFPNSNWIEEDIVDFPEIPVTGGSDWVEEVSVA
jgi:hypothetical protein